RDGLEKRLGGRFEGHGQDDDGRFGHPRLDSLRFRSRDRRRVALRGDPAEVRSGSRNCREGRCRRLVFRVLFAERRATEPRSLSFEAHPDRDGLGTGGAHHRDGSGRLALPRSGLDPELRAGGSAHPPSNALSRPPVPAYDPRMKRNMRAWIVSLFVFVLMGVLPLRSATPTSSSVYPIQEGFVDAHGVMIYYKSIGNGPPLLVLHGGPGASHDYFLPYFLPLARHYRVVFIDERGSGKSEKLEDARRYTVENMVEDAEAVRQALLLGKVALLGHSYGGVIAQAYALKYQSHLSRLLLCSTFSSTKGLNDVFVRMKEKMAPELRERIDKMEKE